MVSKQNHLVAIIGGGVSGSEAAYQLSQRGLSAVVFEKNALPYGKIEEGLPKWHVKLRNQEEKKIDHKLDHPNISFVPKVKLGSDISLNQLQEWGFSATLLAIGALKDKQLPLAGLDKYIGKGLYYQNSLVSWYNHHHEPDYTGPNYELPDNAIVIGGGLASLDVVKILMLETVLREMKNRNLKIDLFTLEREGLPLIFKEHGLSLMKLGLKGCTLYYRRRIIDMPLTSMPPDADDNRKKKVYELRKRILQNYKQKYLFAVKDCLIPVDYLTNKNRLTGLIFQKNEHINDKWMTVPDKPITVSTPLVVSSIGSVPEKLKELPVEGNILQIEDLDSGKIRGYHRVFALGNVVTGRGNIRESLLHSRTVTQTVMEHHLDIAEDEYKDWIRNDELTTGERVDHLIERLQEIPPASEKKVSRLKQKIQELQNKVGYDGRYRNWISEHLPVRLEDLMAEKYQK